jgi:hypothetical protein
MSAWPHCKCHLRNGRLANEYHSSLFESNITGGSYYDCDRSRMAILLDFPGLSIIHAYPDFVVAARKDDLGWTLSDVAS